MATEGIIIIDEEAYTKILSKIQKLHPRKRKNWKSFLTDKFGVRSKLIYQDFQLMNYSLPAGKFLPVMTIQTLAQIDLNLKPLSECGVRVLMGMSCADATAIDIAKNRSGNHAGRVNHHVKIPAPSTW
jgi:hypothetical protein